METSPTASDRIRLLRPVVIAFIVLTHVPAALYRPDLKDLELALGTFLSAWISGVVALAALPTLSVISGWLAVASLKRYRYPGFVGNKVRRLVIPMLLWGIPSALWIWWQQSSGMSYRADLNLHPFNFEGWVRALTAIGKLPANAPLYFLRELFFAALLIPLWRLVARSRIASLLLAGFILYCSLAEINFGFFHRIDIYLYFFIGVFLARNPDIASIGRRLEPYTLPVTGALLVYSALLALYAFGEDPRHFQFLTQIVRLLGPLAFWLLGARLLATPLRGPLLALSPASYTIFLGHSPCLLLIWETWKRLFGFSPYNASYALFTIVALVATFALLSVLWCAYRWTRARALQISPPTRSSR